MATIELNALNALAATSPTPLLTPEVFRQGLFKDFDAIPLVSAISKARVLSEQPYTPTGIFELSTRKPVANTVDIAVNFATSMRKTTFFDDVTTAIERLVPIGDFGIDIPALALACSRRRVPIIGSVTLLENNNNRFGLLLVPSNLRAGAEKSYSLEAANSAKDYTAQVFQEPIITEDERAEVGAQLLTASILHWAIRQMPDIE